MSNDLPCLCVGMADALRSHQVVINEQGKVFYKQESGRRKNQRWRVTEISIKCPFCGEKLWRESV